MAERNFDWFDTPNPTERGFFVVANESDRDCAIPDFINTTVLFSSCPRWITNAATVIPALQSYRLIHAEKAGHLQRRFYFARVRTEAERKQHFAESWEKRPYPWDTVLYKLWAEEGVLPVAAMDTSGNVLNTPRRLVRVKYKPGGTYPTWIRTRHYLSEAPFPKNSAQRVPIPDAIHWEFDGERGGFPACLHPGVTVPFDNTTGNVVFGFGTDAGEIGGDLVKQYFPPTNFSDWESYIAQDERQPVIGKLMEHRIIVEVFPPKDFRAEIKDLA